MVGGDERKEKNYGSNGDVLSAARVKLREVLESYGYTRDDIMISNYKSKLFIRSREDKWTNYGPEGIEITVRKTKSKEYSDWRNTYYNFKCIKIEEVKSWDPTLKQITTIETIEQYLDNKKADAQAAKERRDEKLDNFIGNVNNNTELKTFLELMREYKDLTYDQKKELAEIAFPDKPYMYY